MSRARSWCFTLNNYSADDEAAIALISVKYLVYGREVGESGTPHLQGYVVFVESKTLSAVKKLIPRAHLEPAKGNHEQAETYCIKDGDVVRRGEKPQQGKRTDLHDVIDACKAGSTQRELIEEHTSVYARYPKFVDMCRTVYTAPRDPRVAPNIRVFYGEPGAGKTRSAVEELPQAFMKTPTTLHWWDGYDMQTDVIIDEADKGYLKLCEMLSILDRYPLKVKVHGGVVEFVATNIILTANKHPDDWYPGCSEYERGGLLRRIGEIKMLSKGTTWPSSASVLPADPLDA